MATNDTVFAGSIPELYDRLMVPLIFDVYARDMARRVAAARPSTILETATGTGVVTRAMTAAMPDAALTATDLNQAMLDHARSKHPDAQRIRWQQADALALPFDDAGYDAVVCQFGAMFFPDRVKGYAEARRVLRPGGTFLFSVWDRIADNEFADVITERLAQMFPDDPPRFLARTPHGYHDAARIRDDVVAAGFRNVSIDAVEAVSTAPAAREAAVAYCEGTPLRNEIEARAPGGLARATEAATQALVARFGSGAISGRIKAVMIAATG
ncbi:MAG: class I SAM-dependent methyltransferase [Pseudolabrys sp.]